MKYILIPLFINDATYFFLSLFFLSTFWGIHLHVYFTHVCLFTTYLLKNNCESPEIKTVIIAKNNIGFLAVGFYFGFTLDFYK